MKKVFMFLSAMVFVGMFCSSAQTQECFTNHDCPDVNMNCVHRQCKESIYPSQHKKTPTTEQEINDLIEKRAREISRKNSNNDDEESRSGSRNYIDGKSGRMIHCVGNVCD
jgi:hypothetical protein